MNETFTVLKYLVVDTMGAFHTIGKVIVSHGKERRSNNFMLDGDEEVESRDKHAKDEDRVARVSLPDARHDE